MRKCSIICLLLAVVSMFVSFVDRSSENLRDIYSLPPAQWPAPSIDPGVKWSELGPLPQTPLAYSGDSLKSLIHLGAVLFFDTRLSASGKISCASCHQPSKSWTDGIEKSLGHEGAVNRRNSPSLQHVWFYDKLFWDGRARDLEDQAFAPINSESEMHGDMSNLPAKLRRINGYLHLFEAAFGDADIDPDRIAAALAGFQRTIGSQPSAFDEFLNGNRDALNNSQLRGLHLFRTRARCMNCHHGPLFSDNLFHNNGFAANDVGLYHVTHLEEDRGKFKTPILRDLANTGPWMHDGSQTGLTQIVERYNNAIPTPGQDSLVRPLNLSNRERKDLINFLKAISAPPLPFMQPKLPG